MEQKPAMSPMSPARRRFLEFLASVVLVHVVAITLYYGLHLSQKDPQTQRWFGWGWMFLTVAVVLAGLQRIKRARRNRARGR